MSKQTNKGSMDEALRKALESIEHAYDPGDWNDLEKKLDERDRNNKKGFFRWSTLMVMIFAVMSIVAATYFFSSDYIQNNTGENTLIQNDTKDKNKVNSTTGEKENIKAEPTIANHLEIESQDNESSDPGGNRADEAKTIEFTSDEEKSHQPAIDRSGTTKPEKTPVKIPSSGDTDPASKKNSGVKAGKPGISGANNPKKEIVTNSQPTAASVPVVRSIGYRDDKKNEASPASNPFKKSPVTKKQNSNQSTLAGIQRKQTLSEPVKETLPGKEKKMDDVLQKSDSLSTAPTTSPINSEQSTLLPATDKNSDSAEGVKDSSGTANADSAKEAKNSKTTQPQPPPAELKKPAPSGIEVLNSFNGNFWENPAYTGLEGKHVAHFNYRNQWSKFYRNPIRYLVAYDSEIGKNRKHSLGVYVFYQSHGFSSRGTAALSYSYKMTIGNGILKAGVAVSAIQVGYTGDWRVSQANDPTIPPGNVAGTTPGFNAGLWYQHNKFYIGLSSLSFNSPSIRLSTFKYSHPVEFYFNSGCNLTASDKLVIQPSFSVKKWGPVVTFSPALNSIIANKYVFGVSYLNTNTIAFIAGYKVKRFQVLASYGITPDFLLKEYSSNGIVELLIRYRFGQD